MFETTQVSCSLVEHVHEVEMNALKSGKKFKTTPPVDRPSFDLMMSQLTPIEYQGKTTPTTPVCPIPYNVQLDVPIQGHENRPTRETNLPDNMRSHYANKKVMLAVKRTTVEDNVACTIFASNKDEWNFVFQTKEGVVVPRVLFESLYPGISVHVSVLQAWVSLLNAEDKFRNRYDSPRFFCPPNMLVSL
ncbi:uncharacterized protein LOC143569121 [Bidens hawaiensis]|uniref:uncharacterized protein LOC143569121 n=1 Tax=Bidens hawaiensis TaxID=980011 RepID=UPI00404B220F